ncbi:MAG: quinone oxidoreductase [Bradymonadaceae bacterium]
MTDIHAVRVHETGDADQLTYETIELEPPAPDEIRLRHEAIGVNYIDTYHRGGLYPLEPPFTLGMEGAGVVEETGDAVDLFSPGDRVAYGTGPPGSYAEARNIAADRVVALPDDIDFEEAAAVMLKGMTVEYLVRRTFEVEAGMNVLWHAAAGGVGQIACQWLDAIGATSFGTVSTERKAEMAVEAGCDHPIRYTEEEVPARIEELTGGDGVAVVYDGVGAETFEASLEVLKRRGMLVTFGNASGPPPAIEPLELNRRGSLFLTRPSLMDYVATRGELVGSTDALFERVLVGDIDVTIGQTWPLRRAAEAHRALENRETTGSTVLKP